MGVFDFEHLKDRARLYSVLTCSPELLYCIWSLLGENYSAHSNYPKPAMETAIIQSLLKVPPANSQSLRCSGNQARKNPSWSSHSRVGREEICAKTNKQKS